METYRHATYRYSTGQGFNVNVDVPDETTDVASYKMYPLMQRLGRESFTVNMKREADRVSMQVEAGAQQIKVLGYDSEAGKRYRGLKARLEVIKHLMANYPIEFIKTADLERLYELYEKNTPGLDKIIRKVVKDNKNATGVHTYVGTAMKVRKGYPLFDQFGKKLSAKEEAMYRKSQKNNKGLSGFGEGGTTDIVKLLGLLLIGAAVWKVFKLQTAASPA